MKLAVNVLQKTDGSLEEVVSRLKCKKFQEYSKIRTRVLRAAVECLDDLGFVHPPVTMLAGVTDPLAHETHPPRVDYYGKEVSLTQSLIFQKMVLVSLSDMEKVFFVSPNVRLESSTEGRYATEFTQVDFEQQDIDEKQASSIASEVINAMIESLPPTVTKPELGYVTNLRREAYDYYDYDDKVYKNFDYLVNGVEVCSGARREHEFLRLRNRMQQLGYSLAYFAPVLDIAEKGDLKPCAGAGIGVERFLMGALNLDEIADVYPFARKPKQSIIF